MSSAPEINKIGKLRDPTKSLLYQVSVIIDLIYFTKVKRSFTKSGVDENVFSAIRPLNNEEALCAIYIDTDPPMFLPKR